MRESKRIARRIALKGGITALQHNMVDLIAAALDEEWDAALDAGIKALDRVGSAFTPELRRFKRKRVVYDATPSTPEDV